MKLPFCSLGGCIFRGVGVYRSCFRIWIVYFKCVLIVIIVNEMLFVGLVAVCYFYAVVAYNLFIFNKYLALKVSIFLF